MLTSKNLLVLAALSIASLGSIAGCASDVEADDDGVFDESEADLSAAGKALIGSYTSEGGPFYGLILTNKGVGQANEFIADINTGRKCAVAPCPSDARITGTFTAGTKTINFKSSTAVPSAQHRLGRYNYKVQNGKLTLWRKDFSQSLDEADSYCTRPSDCEVQGIVHVACVGQWVCSGALTCGYDCSVPPPPSQGAVCLSSASCAAGEHCSTEDGVCNPHGMLAVCAGNCVSNQ
jgi:hypothetical protein